MDSRHHIEEGLSPTCQNPKMLGIENFRPQNDILSLLSSNVCAYPFCHLSTKIKLLNFFASALYSLLKVVHF